MSDRADFFKGVLTLYWTQLTVDQEVGYQLTCLGLLIRWHHLHYQQLARAEALFCCCNVSLAGTVINAIDCMSSHLSVCGQGPPTMPWISLAQEETVL